MALPLLNSLHCFKIHDHVILMVKPGVHSFVFQSNQSAAERAEDNGPNE